MKLGDRLIDLTPPQFEMLQEKLKNIPEKIPIVTARAINRAIESARTQASRSTRETYAIKHKDIISTIKLKRAHQADLEANFSSVGSSIELMKFKVRANKPLPTRGKYAIVSVKKGSKQMINKTFVSKIYKETENVYSRVGNKRFPVRAHYGPSVPQMIGYQKVITRVEEKAMEELDKRLDHEIGRVLGGS